MQSTAKGLWLAGILTAGAVGMLRRSSKPSSSKEEEASTELENLHLCEDVLFEHLLHDNEALDKHLKQLLHVLHTKTDKSQWDNLTPEQQRMEMLLVHVSCVLHELEMQRTTLQHNKETVPKTLQTHYESVLAAYNKIQTQVWDMHEQVTQRKN